MVQQKHAGPDQTVTSRTHGAIKTRDANGIKRTNLRNTKQSITETNSIAPRGNNTSVLFPRTTATKESISYKLRTRDNRTNVYS